MNSKEKIQAIQSLLGVSADGIFGSKTQAALNKVIEQSKFPLQSNVEPSISTEIVVEGLASSFADLADVVAFKRCKAQGNSDHVCYRVGDPGLGCYGEDVTTLTIPYVAIPPDYMIDWWGSIESAKFQKVSVTCNGQTHECTVGDRMPWLKNIKNGAVLDMAPGAQKLFGLNPPFMVNCSYQKV